MNIQINITIEIDGASHNISYNDAKKIYKELSKIFSSNHIINNVMTKKHKMLDALDNNQSCYSVVYEKENINNVDPIQKEIEKNFNEMESKLTQLQQQKEEMDKIISNFENR